MARKRGPKDADEAIGTSILTQSLDVLSSVDMRSRDSAGQTIAAGNRARYIKREEMYSMIDIE